MDFYKWHEQESLQNLYESEIGVLKRGLNGDFELIKFLDPNENNGRVVVLGKLMYGGDQEQGIQIIFPTKYPRTLPRIITVDFQYGSNGEINGMSTHHFGNGNQYRDGAICLLRKEDWDSSIHNIGWILRKAQSWLESATSDEGFSPDEIVEEFPAPMPHKGQVLLPKDYELPPDTKTGKFLLKQFKPNHYILEHNILPNSPFSLQVGNESFEWYSFDKGFQFKDIFTSRNPMKLIKIIKQHFSKHPLEGTVQNGFALYIPDKPIPWHFFKISKNSPNGVQLQYLIARNIEEELYLRTKDIFDDKILIKKKVTIIGLGALGSEVGRSLACNAVGHFNLFDKDTFEIGNSVRHAADLFYVGEPKVNVVKRLILRSNPNITVNTYNIDVLNDSGRLEESLLKSDVCIVLTGEDAVDYMLNDLYVPKFNIPFIFARVSAGGLSGSVQVVKYHETPCLRCLSIKNADKLPTPKKKIEFEELPPEFAGCASPALPGSEIDIKEIALQVSRITLQELLGNKNSVYPKSKGKQFYWHGPMGSSNKEPFTWEIRNLKRHPDCLTCKSEE